MDSKAATATSYIYPPSPITERGKPTILDIHIPSERALYCSSNCVIIRSLHNPQQVFGVFNEHQGSTTAARFSPSGSYVCSGDEKGVVMIWNALGDHLTVKQKWDYPLLNGAVRDIAWTFDNERIAVVGEGQKFFGKVFSADTGSQLGEITGQSKNLLSCSFKPSRPFRLATAGEEGSIQYFEGPPFKFKTSHRTHTSFINCVKFAPNAEKFVTVSSDKKVFLYNGLTGEIISELFTNGHTGGILQCDWLEDSNSLATASSDKQIRVWNVPTQELLKTLQVAVIPTLQDQQVSIKVCKNDIYSVSLSGDINVWKNAHQLEDNSLPTLILRGHSGSINQIALVPGTNQLISSDANGRILVWGNDKVAKLPAGKQSEGAIIRFRLNLDSSKVFSFSGSQNLNILDLNSLTWREELPIEGKTLDIQASKVNEDEVFLLQENKIIFIKGRTEKETIPFKHASTVFDVTANDSLFAIGNDRGNVLLISRKGENLGILEHYGAKISAIAFSHNGRLLACGDSSYRIRLWDIESKQSLTEKLVFSSAMINTIEFSINDAYIISSSLDNKAVIYNTSNFAKEESFDLAHKRGMNCAIFRKDSQSILTCGSDNLIKEHSSKVPFNS